MKTLLINPSYQPHWSRCEPTGLLYVSAYLESKNVVADILDMNVENKKPKEIIDLIKKESYNFVGISAITCQILGAYNIGKKIKKELDVQLIYGGVHPTLMPEESFVLGEADFVVIGEGEHTFFEIINAITKKQDVKSIDGIYYKSGDIIHKTKKRKFLENLDSLPYPNYSKIPLEKFNSNIHLHDHPGQAIHLMTSRGCLGNCYYCASPKLYKKHVRFRSSENILNEIKNIISKHHVKNIHFHDDNFMLHRERIEELCEKTIEYHIHFKWIALATIHSILESQDILPLMRKSGCVGMEIGVESGDIKVLKKLNKSMRIDDIISASNILKENKISPMYLYMSYSLGENIDSPYKSARLYNIMHHNISEVPVETSLYNPALAGHLARPSPGSAFYSFADKMGKTFLRNWDDHIEERLNFLPHTFLNDTPIKNRHYASFAAFKDELRKYKNNLELYANQNFYNSQIIMKEHFYNSPDELIAHMYKVYKEVNGQATVLDISERSDLIKDATAISMMSIFRIIKSKEG